jgi:hypothetical protein
MNKYLIFSFFLLLHIFGNAQSFGPKNISKVIGDYNNQSQNSFLASKGFQSTTATENGRTWYNPKTKESLELFYDKAYYSEGGKHTVVIYYLKNGLHHNFIKQLDAAKFVYSKRNKQYVKRFNTYTYETLKIESVGKDATITYINHLGKEDGSYPGFNIPKPSKENVQQSINYSNAKYLTSPVSQTQPSHLMAFMQFPEIIVANVDEDDNVTIDVKISDTATLESVDADIPAKFNGNGKELKRFLYRLDTYEIFENIESDLFGNAVLTFIIENDGNITEINMLQPFNNVADKEIIQLFKRIPKFYPAKHNGNWIRCRVLVPFKFAMKARKKRTILISDPITSTRTIFNNDTITKSQKTNRDSIVKKFVHNKLVEKARFLDGKLVANKNFTTNDFKRFTTDSKMIYHSFYQNDKKEYVVEEWSSDGKLAYKSVYNNKAKEILVYNYQILFQKKKILKSGKLWVTEYDKDGKIVSESEAYETQVPENEDESED